MGSRSIWQIALVTLALAGSGAVVQAKVRKPQDSSPQILKQLVDCRPLTDAAARLACYDKGVAALETAAAAHEVVIADKEMIREARRAQFGYTMPSLRIFGGDDAKDDVAEVATKVTDVRMQGMGLLRFTTVEGSVWQQTESKTLSRDPKPGSTVTIHRRALGRYSASFEGTSSITVRRVQ